MPKSRLCVGTGVISDPSRRIAPLVGVSSPAIIRSRVVFPQPEGPSMQTKVPCGTVNCTLSTSVNVLNCFETLFNAKPDIRISPEMGRRPGAGCRKVYAVFGQHPAPTL